MFRLKIELTFIFLLALSFFGLGLSLASPNVSALSGSEFKVGRIIDDGVFFDSSTMTRQEIQQFLNAKVPTCDTNGSKIYSGSTTRAQYGASVGNPAPYTCLKDYSENTVSRAAEAGLCNAYNGGTYSSSQIIYDVAQACGVSPKVLIVLLQKEQALVTDDWPWPGQYRSATGFGCPDTAPCDTQYYGFFNQVYNAARIYRYYAKNASQYNFSAYRNNNVQFNPDTTCGTGTVYIENQATAGLYTYTPYQPNAPALNNLYGSGDGCSAYGNRNFWRLFIDWFGSVSAAPYVANYFSQSPSAQVNPGQTTSIYLMYQNRGSMFWYDDTSLANAPAGTYPVHLATSKTINRCSSFSSSWVSCSRPATTFSAVFESDGVTLAVDQHVAKPGQIVKFSINISAPTMYSAGTYNEYFQPVAEGSTTQFFNDQGTYITVIVNPIKSISWLKQSENPTLAPTDNFSSFVELRNTGNIPLFDDSSISNAPTGNYPTHLAVSCPLNSSSIFSDGWPSTSRPAVNFAAVYNADGVTLSSDQHTAQPGQVVKFSYSVRSPNQIAAGVYRVCVRPILEGIADGAYADQGIYSDITVPTTAAVGYTLQPPTSSVIASGEQKTITYQIINYGNSTIAAGATVTTNNGLDYRDSSWASGFTITTLASAIPPGATSSIQLTLLAPTTNVYRSDILSFNLIDGTGNIIHKSNFTATFNSTPPRYGAAYYNESQSPSFTYGQTKSVYYSYKNTGNKPWYDDLSVNSTVQTRSPQPTHLATANPINRPSGFVSNWPSANRPAVLFSAVYEADGMTLAADQHVVQPGQIGKYTFNVSPADWVNPGIYREYVQPIIEGMPDGAINTQGTYLNHSLSAPAYAASYFSQSPYPSLTTGQVKSVYIAYKNIGNATWFDDSSFPSAPANSRLYRTHLATTKPLNRPSSFDAGWPSANRPAVLFSAVYEADGMTLAADQHVVQPGQIGKYTFNVMEPSNQTMGTYREFFQPIAENSLYGEFNDPGTFLDLVSQ